MIIIRLVCSNNFLSENHQSFLATGMTMLKEREIDDIFNISIINRDSLIGNHFDQRTFSH